MRLQPEFAALAHTLEAEDARVYYDVTPLLVSQWTGIPAVAGAYAQQIYDLKNDRFKFFADDVLVNHDLVSQMLDSRTGLFVARSLQHRRSQFQPLDIYSQQGLNIGFYPSVKRDPGKFDREISIVHDLSTHITPFFHVKANVRYHLEYIADEIRTNDITLAVSQATADDIAYYFGTEIERLGVVHNAVGWPKEFDIKFQSELGTAFVEPFILVLGTREPRKNHQVIFDMLARWPSLLEQYRFVFTGRAGWLEDRVNMPIEVLRGFERKRILHTGFVDEYTKYKLLKLADFTIYASMFEGFGLPILESLSIGTPCITSFSTSHPEVGGAAALYFDPLSASDLYDKIGLLSRMTEQELQFLYEASVNQGLKFSWDASFQCLCYQIHRLFRR